MNNSLIIHENPLSVYWSQPSLRRLLRHATPEQVLNTISLLFTLCGQGQQLAARLLLFPDQRHDRRAAQQELIFETLRRLLGDWLPAFAQRDASASEWQALRSGQYATLAQTLIFGQPAEHWLAAGYLYWLRWIEQQPTEMSRWIASLWPLKLPALPLICEADSGLLATLSDTADTALYPPAEVSPLALESVVLAADSASGEHLAALRLLARCVALARALSQPDSLRWRVFNACGWQVAAVETARGWLTHQLRREPSGRIADYLITPPTRRHSHADGVIKQTLAAVAKTQWSRQLLIIDPCVAVSVR